MDSCQNENCLGHAEVDASGLCNSCEIRFNSTNEQLGKKIDYLMNQRYTNKTLLYMCIDERKKRKDIERKRKKIDNKKEVIS